MPENSSRTPAYNSRHQPNTEVGSAGVNNQLKNIYIFFQIFIKVVLVFTVLAVGYSL
jgi:hypothetical protein